MKRGQRKRKTQVRPYDKTSGTNTTKTGNTISANESSSIDIHDQPSTYQLTKTGSHVATTSSRTGGNIDALVSDIPGSNYKLVQTSLSQNSTTTIINLSNVTNVQIGEHNVIHYGTANTKHEGQPLQTEEDQAVADTPNPETLLQGPFVGRKKELGIIKAAVTTRPRTLIQLYGLTMVGKKRLVQQAHLEMMIENIPLKYTHIPCTDVTSWDEFLRMFLAICDIDHDQRTTEPIKQQLIISYFKNSIRSHAHILHLTNCETFSKLFCGKKFERFIINLTDSHPNCRIIVTSQYYYCFENKGLDVKVSRLSTSDSFRLLQNVVPNIDVSQYKNVVGECCFGLPPFILDAADLIKDSNAMRCCYSADELRHLLDEDVRSTRIFAEMSQHEKDLLDYFPGLTGNLEQQVKELSIFRGSFGFKSIKAVIASESDKDFAIVKNKILRLCKNSILTEPRKERMRIQPVVESYIRHVLPKHVMYSDVVRLKFVKFFGEVLTKANSELYQQSEQTVYGYLKDDWLNLEQVLKEAIHCTENTYEIFFKVAADASTLLVNCFPMNETLCFYETMTNATNTFGTDQHMAVLNVQLGRIKTTRNGVDLEEAFDLYNDALKILIGCGACRDLASLYRFMGFNYYKREKYQDTLRCCRTGLEIIKKIEIDTSTTKEMIDTRSLLSIALIFRGEFKVAKDLLETTIDLAKECNHFLPAIPVMINSLGLIYERSGQNQELAFKYYRNSLSIRRKFVHIIPSCLIVPLINVAMQYSRRHEYKHGLRHLEECLSICKKLGKKDYDTANTLWHMSKINAQLGNLDKAIELAQEAKQIFMVCAKDNSIQVQLRLMLSHYFVIKKNAKEARTCLKECWNHGIHVEDTHHYLLALGHLTLLVQSNHDFLEEALNRFIQEAIRLMTVPSIKQPFESMVTCAQQYLLNLKNGVVADDNFVSDLHRTCFVCKEMDERGYDSRHCWQEAVLEWSQEAAITERLMNHPAIQAAIDITLHL